MLGYPCYLRFNTNLPCVFSPRLKKLLTKLPSYCYFLLNTILPRVFSVQLKELGAKVKVVMISWFHKQTLSRSHNENLGVTLRPPSLDFYTVLIVTTRGGGGGEQWKLQASLQALVSTTVLIITLEGLLFGGQSGHKHPTFCPAQVRSGATSSELWS